MKHLIAALLFIAQSATAGLFDKSKYGIGEERELAKAILNNDLEPIKTFIKNKSEIGEYGSNSSKLVLWLSTNDSAWSSGNALSYGVKMPERVCKPEVVKLLLADGVSPTEESGIKGSENNSHLSGAVKSFCKESFDLLLPKSNANDVVAASKQINFTLLSQIKNDAALATNAASIVQSLIASNELNCKSKNAASCDAVKNLKNEMAQLMDHEKAVMHSQTPEGQAEDLSSEICELIKESNELDLAMKEERQKSKVSGYTNALKLKTTGDRLFEIKKTIEQKKQQFKTVSKKSFNIKPCK